MITLTGKIFGKENGRYEPLIGAHIAAIDPITQNTLLANGEAVGASTDIEGRYSLRVPSLNLDNIRVSYLGYETLFTTAARLRSQGNIYLDEATGAELPVTTIIGYKPEAKKKSAVPAWLWALISAASLLFIFIIFQITQNAKTGSKPPVKLR